MDNTIITSVLSMAGLGFFFASILAVVNQKLKVKEDPKVEAISEALPGINCAACGFTSCHQYAETLAKGEVGPDLCKAGGEAVACRLCEILGVKAEKHLKHAAIVRCGADASVREKKAVYTGIKTCVAAHNTSGGEILCAYGCLGYGDCIKACPFGAITLVNGLAKVDKEKCTACGKCVAACPRKIITLENIESPKFLYVACSNLERAADTRKTCRVGCIACGICQKLTGGVFSVENNLARVKYDRTGGIKDTKEIVDKCPVKCIMCF